MNTLIITNKEEIFNQIKEKLVLLRETDVVAHSDYDRAPDKLYEIRPDIVMLHLNEEHEKTLQLIKNVREKKLYENSKILLLIDNYEQQLVLDAYDAGIYDYISINSEPSEILIRIINCIKHIDLQRQADRYAINLKSYGILDSKSGFYNAKYEKDIFDVVIHMDNYKNGCYIILSPNDTTKKNFSEEVLVKALNKSVRKNDYVANLSGAKYSIMVKSSLEGSIKIIQKIKQQLPDEYNISAGIAVIDDENFEYIKKRAVCAINNAMLKNLEYFVYSQNENNSDDWLETPAKDEKTYKLFKSALTKRIENVISPVFYRIQKSYEEKLPEAKIEQFTDEAQSVFRIISGNSESRITMRYPGYSKLIIYISHKGLDSPENREISLPIKEITETKIDEILESFIGEFIGIYRHVYNS